MKDPVIYCEICMQPLPANHSPNAKTHVGECRRIAQNLRNQRRYKRKSELGHYMRGAAATPSGSSQASSSCYRLSGVRMCEDGTIVREIQVHEIEA